MAGVLRNSGLTVLAIFLFSISAFSQSIDWKEAVYREPQVRYLLTDMTLGGEVNMYRAYAEEGDPDSREAIRLWDSGARVVNTADFERKWITNEHGEQGQVLRIVFRRTERTIAGTEALMSCDFNYQQAPMRTILADLTLGPSLSFYELLKSDPNVVEALTRWRAGVRVTNTHLFDISEKGAQRTIVYIDTAIPIDGSHVLLNSDVPYPETNVRYFMADMALGADIEFYRHAAEKDHEMGCLEAVHRIEQGYKIVNLDQFERKQVAGKTVITRKGSSERISGMAVVLSSD